MPKVSTPQTDKINVFIPIQKVDEEQRLVYGQVAAEIEDNSGETFDYDGSKPYFQKWSDNAFNTSGGKSYGNLRVMHTSKVAGIIASPLGFDDDNRIISACAKVVDDDEWKKVLSGCYTGFSMGGRYVHRVTKGTEKRYVADPAEISLVDKPCIRTATFEVVKADGIEQRHFSEELVSDDGVDLEKAAGKQARVPAGSPKGGQFASSAGPITAGAKAAGWTEKNWKKEFANYEARGISPTHAAAARRGMASYTKGPVKQLHEDVASAWDRIAASSSVATKSDNGENIMYVPTNDEMLPIAKDLAKADGKTENDWLAYMDAARDHLIAKAAGRDDAECASGAAKSDDEDETESDVEKGDNPFAKDKGEAKNGEDEGDEDEDETEDGEEDEEKEDKDAKKSDTPEVEQGWRAKDGTFFVKKADALAHNDALEKSDNGEPSLVDQLRSLTEVAERVAKGELIEEEEAEASDAVTKADVLSVIVEPMAKLNDFIGNELVKGMYGVQRLASIIESLGYLHSSVSYEAQSERDNSPLPDELLGSLKSLGSTLITMANEEVEELVAAAEKNSAQNQTDEVLALACSTLGLEKSALVDSLRKRAPEDDGSGLLQKMDEANKRADEALAKVDKLEAERVEIVDLVKGLQNQIEAIKKMPLGKAPTTSLAKGDAVAETSKPEDLLAKFTPDQIADAAIRLSQQHGRNVFLPASGQ